MKIQKKPDYLIFADSAKKGESAEFPDISRGWGVTIEQTASKPPLEWMNGAFNRIDKNMLYLLQQGVPEWSEEVIYPINAIIKYNGVLYTAIVENDNAKPSTNTTKWKKTQAEIPNASTTQNGIVKLSSATDSTSETESATPFAVKLVNDLANIAQSNANNAHDRITELSSYAVSVNGKADDAHNRINDTISKFSHDSEQSVVFSPNRQFQLVVRNDGLIGVYSEKTNNIEWSFYGNDLNNGSIDISKIRNLQTGVCNLFQQGWNDISGFVKLPSGVVIQWGKIDFAGSWGINGGVGTFYTTFPHACFMIVCSDRDGGAHPGGASPISNSQFKYWGKSNEFTYKDTTLGYIAIGV